MESTTVTPGPSEANVGRLFRAEVRKLPARGTAGDNICNGGTMDILGSERDSFHTSVKFALSALYR